MFLMCLLLVLVALVLVSVLWFIYFTSSYLLSSTLVFPITMSEILIISEIPLSIVAKTISILEVRRLPKCSALNVQHSLLILAAVSD